MPTQMPRNGRHAGADRGHASGREVRPRRHGCGQPPLRGGGSARDRRSATSPSGSAGGAASPGGSGTGRFRGSSGVFPTPCRRSPASSACPAAARWSRRTGRRPARKHPCLESSPDPAFSGGGSGDRGFPQPVHIRTAVRAGGARRPQGCGRPAGSFRASGGGVRRPVLPHAPVAERDVHGHDRFPHDRGHGDLVALAPFPEPDVERRHLPDELTDRMAYRSVITVQSDVTGMLVGVDGGVPIGVGMDEALQRLRFLVGNHLRAYLPGVAILDGGHH